jgi:hypothetical protein
LAEFEEVDFQLLSHDPAAVVLRTTLRYDLHVRPATFLYGELCEQPWFERLCLRRGNSDAWVDFEPLSLVSLALSRGELIDLRLVAPYDLDALQAVMRAFRDCPLYRDYSSEARRPKLDTTPAEEAQFAREFASDDSAFAMIKLNLENFIVGHVTEIEGHLLRRDPEGVPSGDVLKNKLRDLLFEVFEHFGFVSLDLPLDNLMQTRDMCYHLHFEQLQKNQKIPYGLMGIEWGQENGLAWRRTQACRHCYYFEREHTFYCDLFLLLVLRGRERLRLFVSRWHERLDQSLHLRHRLGDQLHRIEREMDNFSPNFDEPDEFRRHIRLLCELVHNDLSRLTGYVELVRAERIFHE